MLILMQLMVMVTSFALVFRRAWTRRRGQIARRMAAFRAVERPPMGDVPVRVSLKKLAL